MHKIIGFLGILRKNYEPFIGSAGVLFALLMVGQVFALSLPYFEGKIIDNLAERAPFGDSLFLGFAILAVYWSANLLHYVRERFEIARLDFDLTKYVNTVTLEKLFRFSFGQHINENSGLRLSVLNRGTNALNQFMSLFVYSLLPFVLQILLATVALFFVNPILGVIVLVTSSVFASLLFRYNMKFYPSLVENRDRWNKQSKHYTEMLRNVKLVKLAAKEEAIVREYREYYETVSEPAKKMWGEYMRAYFTRSTLVPFGRFAALMTGVYLVTVGVESPGTIVMFIGWMAIVFSNLGNLGWVQRQMLSHIGDINKYNDMLEREPAVKEAEHPTVLPKIGGRVEFRNVSFSYPRLASLDDEKNGDENGPKNEEEVSKEILRNVSFAIEPGETVAIVGRSGAGKTTVINLLLRGYDPDEGAILVDGTDLRNIEQKSYLRAIGYVPQFVELFDNSLRYNLTFSMGEPERATEKMLEDIAAKARIDQFYGRLGEKKFETLIGENGIKLSGGERQRVGIARALLQQPEILIFDEATSNLDAENEALIHEAMREALKGRTGIIIAHRLSTIRDADKIIVMDDGAVVGIGTHEALMETCESYRKLIERQVVAL
ncbi:MAG: ABC transporter ATP-binding protein [bacterium]|nr:ABC transporter ATP-binding protein [bacterium]